MGAKSHITVRPDGHIGWPASLQQQAALGLQSSRLNDCLEVVRAEGLRGDFGRFPEFKERNLNVLADLPNLAEVQLWDIELDNLDGLFNLPRLRFLRISGKRPAIDFARLKTLRWLIVEHRPKDRGFAELDELTLMHSWRYKPTSGTSFDLSLPASLQDLQIVFSTAEAISLPRPVPGLRGLELARCRNLRNLGDLRSTFPNLQHLVVQACGRLTTDEVERATAGHPTLTRVVAASRLILGQN